MKEPKLPRAALPRLIRFARITRRTLVIVHWLDANFDSSGRIVDGNIRAGIGCPDSTIGYYHGVYNGCVVLSESVYIDNSGSESHRHIWSIPVSLVIRVDKLKPANHKRKKPR